MLSHRTAVMRLSIPLAVHCWIPLLLVVIWLGLLNTHACAAAFAAGVAGCSIPSVLMSSVLRPPEGGVALQLYEQGLNTLFLFVAVSVAYGMVREPQVLTMICCSTCCACSALQQATYRMCRRTSAFPALR
jgi:hypothetical protein